MPHYVCPACGGEADHPKACETPGCPRHGQPLLPCNCQDEKHAEALSAAPAADDQ